MTEYREARITDGTGSEISTGNSGEGSIPDAVLVKGLYKNKVRDRENRKTDAQLSQVYFGR